MSANEPAKAPAMKELKRMEAELGEMQKARLEMAQEMDTLPKQKNEKTTKKLDAQDSTTTNASIEKEMADLKGELQQQIARLINLIKELDEHMKDKASDIQRRQQVFAKAGREL